MRRLLIFLLLVGLADASCRNFYDYCYTGSFTNSTVLDLRGVSGSNLESQAYVNNNLTNVYSSVGGTGTWSLTRYNSPEYPIFLFYMNSSGTGSLTVCLNGSQEISTYDGGVFDTSGASYSVKTFTLSDFTSYYRRNWTFTNELDNTIYNFTGHTAILTVSCDTLASFTINLTSTVGNGGSLTIQTTEQPRYSMSVDGNEHARMEPTHYLKDNYLVLVPGSAYEFDLVDYAGQCNGYLVFKKSIGDSYYTAYSSYFGLERDIYATLDNNTLYKIQLYCKNNVVHDFGTIKLGTKTQRDVEVANVELTGQPSKYSGNLTADFYCDYDTLTASYKYSKTEGIVSVVNYTVYDTNQTPYLQVYNSYQTNTSSGELIYTVADKTHIYYQTVYVLNEGMPVPKARTCHLTNETNANWIEDYFNLPPTIMGVSVSTLLKLTGLGTGVVLSMAFAPADAMFVAAFLLLWLLFMDLLKFLNIPAFLKVIIGLLALALIWGGARRHDE